MDEFPEDQEPTGQAAHVAEEVAATSEDMDPALHPVHVATPPSEYDPFQHGLHSTLPRSGVWNPAEQGWH
jgi:hypothetical protein